MKIAARLSVFLLFVGGGEVWADYGKGMASYAQHDYQTAYREFMDAADHGDSDALINLWIMASQPRCGSPASVADGEKLLCKAAEANNVVAKFLVGESNFWGGGSKGMCGKKTEYIEGKNEAEVMHNFLSLAEAAAKQGFPGAMMVASGFYENVTNPPDPVRAYAWYTVAARRLKEDVRAEAAAKLSPEEKVRAQQMAEKLDGETPKTKLLEVDFQQTCQPAGPFEEGMAALGRGDYETAYGLFLPLAKRGMPRRSLTSAFCPPPARGWRRTMSMPLVGFARLQIRG